MRAIMSAISPQEKKAALSIAALVSLRVYGLFLILPVFSVYAEQLPFATPMLIGLAVGVYGLTQAILQVPMGLLSDFWGRKKVMALGLVMFLVGSVVAALANDIYWILVGRCIQGMGAIASTGMAFIADVSRPEQRAKMMGIVGASIGFAFMLSFITGPILAQWIGVKGLFWFTAFLAVCALLLLFSSISEPEKKVKKGFSWAELLVAVKQKDLLLLDVFVFLLHASMTAIFVVLPLVMVHRLSFETSHHWQFYVPVLVLSLFIMVPLIIAQEKKQQHVLFMLVALICLSFSVLFLGLGLDALWLLAVLMTLYFGLFNFLEAAMPSFLSKRADDRYRGAAMGMYSSSQFFGAFIGGVLAGYVMQWQYEYVFYTVFALLFVVSILGIKVFKQP